VITAAASMVVVFAGFVLGVGRPAVAGNPTGGPVPMQSRQLDLTRHRLPRRRRYACDVCGRPAPAWKITLRTIKGRPGRRCMVKRRCDSIPGALAGTCLVSGLLMEAFMPAEVIQAGLRQPTNHHEPDKPHDAETALGAYTVDDQHG
jgi:hypothetical protein